MDDLTARALKDFTARYCDAWHEEHKSWPLSEELYGVPSPCIISTTEDAVYWQPQPHQFNSTQPFFMDTMEPLEWLQWVLIPRMHDLLDNNQPLPGAFAVAPYYEMALATDHPQRALILAELEKLDALFADDAS